MSTAIGTLVSFEEGVCVSSCVQFSFLRKGVLVFTAFEGDPEGDRFPMAKVTFAHDRGLVDGTQRCWGFFDLVTGQVLPPDAVAGAFLSHELSLVQAVGLFDALNNDISKRVCEPTVQDDRGQPCPDMGTYDAPRFTATGTLQVDFRSHVGSEGSVYNSYILSLPTPSEPTRFGVSYNLQSTWVGHK